MANTLDWLFLVQYISPDKLSQYELFREKTSGDYRIMSTHGKETTEVILTEAEAKFFAKYIVSVHLK